MYQKYLKRFVDIVVSFTGILLAFPIFCLVALLLLIANKTNPFFFQSRPGKNEKLFKIIKFKTMTNATDNQGNLLPDEHRLTAIGRFIRSTSLDELPQLLNVLKGDMSLVGPRPLLPEYLPLYNNEQKKRHKVKPGLTGWAQVNGRNALSWNDKFKLDVWYVKNGSFWLDIKIYWLTLKKVLLKEGIASKNSVTMEKYKGN